MPGMKTMDASRVRGAFAAVIEDVRETAETVVIVRYGRPVAALVPLDRLSLRERLAIEQDARRSARESNGPR